MTDPMLRKLARQLVSVDKRVHDLETVPQLAHSSIDDSALPVYDQDGNLVAKVGKQDDGTWGAPPLSGPTPPAPRGVTATGGPGTINIAWTGEFVRDAAPLDFDTLEVLVDGVLAGAIPNRDGGTVSISAEQGYRFVAARIRTLVPRHSATTSPFSVEVGPPADQLFVEAGERIEAAEGQIQAGKDALDAERLAREAALATTRQEVTAEIVASANGKNAITVSADAPTSSTPGAVVGDTWWRVDATGDISGQWSWTGSEWSARTVTSEVIANLDVGKLTVSGTSRFTKAVVDQLFADIFAAHKITASEITIAALDENGEIKPDSVEAVMIKDGAVSANKILLLGDPDDPDEAALVATIASIMKLAVENLVVTDGATIDSAVIEKIASQMVTAGVIRTAESGQRVVIDQSGIVMYGVDPDGVEFELVRIGPSGDNLITAGETTISPAGVRAPEGDFASLSIGGDSLSDVLWNLPRGVRAWGTLSENSKLDSSNTFVRRAELQTTLEPDRLYRVKVNSRYLYNTGSTPTYVTDVLHYSYDATPILPNSIGTGVSQGFSGRHYLPSGTYYTAPPLEFMVDTSGQDGDRVFWAMYSYRTHNASTPVYIVAGSTNPIAMSIEDVGPYVPRTLKRWNDGDGGGSQDTAPIVVRRTATWAHGGFGGDTRSGNIYQGSYGSYGNRYGGWIFSASMRSALAGSTIEKLEVYLENTHWYYGSGGTARIVPNDGSYKGVSFGSTNVQSSSWPRYAGRWVTIPSAWYPYIANGTYKGVSTYATSTSLTYYGQFKGSATKFRATYRK